MSKLMLMVFIAASFASSSYASEQITKVACAPLAEIRRQEFAQAWKENPKGLASPGDFTRKAAFNLATTFFPASSRLLLHARPSEWVTDATVGSMIRIRSAQLGRISVSEEHDRYQRSFYTISPIHFEGHDLSVSIRPQSDQFRVTVCNLNGPRVCTIADSGESESTFRASREKLRQEQFRGDAPLMFATVDQYLEASLPLVCPRKALAAHVVNETPRGASQKLLPLVLDDEPVARPSRGRDTGAQPLR